MAGCARRLAPWTAWLAATATMGSGVPTAANLALHTATRGLWVAGAAVEAAHRHHTPSTAGRRLLAAIPANLPPPRVVPLEDETVPVLCERAALTAERLRQAAWSFARQARWSPAATSHSWRRAAFASAITGHASELILHLMEERATTLGTEPAVRTQLNQAADAIRQAWHARRVLASEWDILTTGTHKAKAISPVTAELGDLVLRTGRLAYANPRWTPASGTATPRDPASLAPARRDLGAILAAVHHAADALARIAVEDRAAVGTAATDGRLYLPTRLMPAECDIPRRYTPAPRSRTGTLLALYEHVIAADTRAVAALDTLAESLGSPSELLAAARAVSSKPAHAPQPPSERAHRTATVAVGRDRERGRWHLPEPAHRHITPRPGTASASKRPRPAPTSHRQ